MHSFLKFHPSWYILSLQSIHVCQTGFTWTPTYFIDQWSRFSFRGQVAFPDTLRNMTTLFGVLNDIKPVYFSVWQGSYEIDLIFLLLWFFGQLYMEYGMIFMCVSLFDIVHHTLTSFL